MTDAKIFEVHRLAQSAVSDAREAFHAAKSASAQVEHHEKICAERYQVIGDQLKEIKDAASKGNESQKTSNAKIYETMHRLEVAFATITAAAGSKTSTTDYVLRWAGLCAGMLGVAYGILK